MVKKTVLIADKMRPFSHVPGVKVLVPFTDFYAVCYPSKLVLFDFSGNIAASWDLPGTYPVKQFTVILDMEKAEVQIFGFSEDGYFRYILKRIADALILKGDRGEKIKNFSKSLPLKHCECSISETRLFLGKSKAKDWGMILRRKDLAEILPLWHSFGNYVTLESEPQFNQNSLLGDCEKVVDAREKLHVVEKFTDLFLASFKGMGVTFADDSDYLGFSKPPTFGDPLEILSQGKKLIEKLFVQADDEKIELLPVCPPDFFSGRLVKAQVNEFGTIDLEWTKKMPRRLIFSSKTEGRLKFCFPKDAVKCRLKDTRGTRSFNNGDTLTFQPNCCYQFDNFTS